MHRLTLVSVVCLLVSLPLLQAAGAGSVQAPPELVVYYPANPVLARQEFRDAGVLTLQVPVDEFSPLGLLVIEGIDQTSDSIDTNIYDIPADESRPITVSEVVDVMVLEGTVRDMPASLASLYLGQQGVYGFVAIESGLTRIEYWFDSNSADERAGNPFVQKVAISKVTIPDSALVANLGQDFESGRPAETVLQDPVGPGSSIPALPIPSLGATTGLQRNDLGPLHPLEVLAFQASTADPARIPSADASQGPGLAGIADWSSASGDPLGLQVAPTPADLVPDVSVGAFAPKAVTATWVCPATPAAAKIWYISTQGFVDSNPASWYDRMVSANTADKPAWSSVCINLQGRFGRTSDIVTGDSTHTSNDCDAAWTQFGEWLQRNKSRILGISTDQVGYQLWTAADLSSGGNTYSCFGVGSNNAVPWQSLAGTQRQDRALTARSIVEGRDVNCCDLYDPSETKQRAVVSGHELGHMFGEENHPNGNCSGEANMMQDSGQLRKYTSPCFLTSSKNEVNYWFFSHAEP